jgi:hypothetical protein
LIFIKKYIIIFIVNEKEVKNMYELNLTETEIAIVMQALSHYQYNNVHVSEEQYDIAENILNKIDEII